MSNFTFENKGTNTYLVYAIEENDVVDSMSLGMLTNNKIKGLAAAFFMQMDAKKYIKYNVSSKVSVKQFFMGPVNKKRLVGVLEGIVNAVVSAEDYMIDIDSIIFDLDYIFTDVSACETVLICLPLEQDKTVSNDLCTFLKNIMFSTQFDQTENCDYVARIINFLNSNAKISVQDFKNLIDDINNKQNGSQNMVSKPAQVSAPIEQKVQSAPVENKAVTFSSANLQPQSNVGQPMSQSRPVMQSQPMAQQVAQPQNTVSQQVRPMQSSNAMPVQKPPVQGAAQMNIPGAAPAKAPGGTGEKPMSMMTLLAHYNKENAEKYKQQKAAKKAAAVAAKNSSKTPAPAQAGNKVQSAPTNAGFNIPGQSAPANSMNYAIPGQAGPSNMSSMAQPVSKPMTSQSTANNQVPLSNAVVQPQKPAVTPNSAPAPAGNVYQGNVMPQMQSMNFGETTVLGGGGSSNIGETTVLSATNVMVEKKPFLIRMKNNEKIPVDKPVFRIGKEKSYVDYFIGDNTAISRSHASVITREGQYYVIDTNSTNHTYVNGSMIASNVETPISSGAKVRLANEEFEFKII